ncbi:MAG: DNA double-strand break repair nuclease NurA [Candidatus Aenigmatarchaeota archaeon]
MDFEVFFNFIKNKDLLKEKIKGIKETPKINLKNVWKNYLPREKGDCCVAIDGSYNYLKFRSMIFYAINISSVFYYNDEKIETKSFPEFNVTEDFLFFEDVLRSEMINRELEIASNLCKDFNVMIDGSLNSFLNFITKDKRKEILSKFESTNKLVFSISKTPIKKIDESIEMGFSDMFEKYKENNIVSFFFKLREDSLTFKVETFEKNKNKIEEIVSLIRFFEFRGYPYLLIKAHRKAKITNKDMEKFANILEIKEKTGREIL